MVKECKVKGKVKNPAGLLSGDRAGQHLRKLHVQRRSNVILISTEKTLPV